MILFLEEIKQNSLHIYFLNSNLLLSLYYTGSKISPSLPLGFLGPRGGRGVENDTEVEEDNVCPPLLGTPRMSSPSVPAAAQQVGFIEAQLLKSRFENQG